MRENPGLSKAADEAVDLWVGGEFVLVSLCAFQRGFRKTRGFTRKFIETCSSRRLNRNAENYSAWKGGVATIITREWREWWDSPTHPPSLLFVCQQLAARHTECMNTGWTAWMRRWNSTVSPSLWNNKEAVGIITQSNGRMRWWLFLFTLAHCPVLSLFQQLRFSSTSDPRSRDSLSFGLVVVIEQVVEDKQQQQLGNIVLPPEYNWIPGFCS